MKQQKLKITDNQFRKGSLAHKLTKRQMYGGSLQYRKLKRPVSTGKSIHITFKMTDIAFKHSGGFRREASNINKKLLVLCDRFQIRKYEHSVNGNHIHLLCKVSDEKDLGRFLRAFAGSVGLYYKLKYNIAGIWQGRPFTRLVTWGREYRSVCKYIVKNFREVVGFVKYTPRDSRSYEFIDQWMSTA